jgi:hypothetical protein
MSTESKLKVLQGQADKLGLSYHHRTGVEKLRAQIGAYLLDNPMKAGLLLSEGILEVPAGATEKLPPAKPNMDYVPLTGDEYKAKSQKAAKIQVGALRRIQFTNMNPTKKEWKGEMISVGSSKLGTFKKYVFFNNKPYHVPEIIYQAMKERMCTVYHTEEGRGGDKRVGELINEYAIVDLPPLTSEELANLASQQALAANGL